ncbi:MAG: AAA family ATPase [Chloroflexi bacterium]|nr:AAA family ATPase [Chloroflexota bacterium]
MLGHAHEAAGVSTTPEKVSTGVVGLDAVLGGGLPAQRLHLIEGAPGTGKTTLAIQFLMEGVRQGEAVLYVALSETVDELNAVARSHGWALEGIHFHQLAPSEESLSPESQYTILQPAEIELGERTWSVLEEFDRIKPTRLVIDSLAELALLAHDPLRYRRQILGLKQFFAGRNCTVLLLDNVDRSTSGVESIAHGVVQLEQLAPIYGSERRRLRVTKLRGARYRGGYHDFVIETGGVHVFPRLIAAEHHIAFTAEEVSSGVPEFDGLLGGGLQRGTSALFVGPAGVGKSVLASRYAAAAAERGECTAIYIFDEGTETFLRRSEGLQIRLREHVEAKQVQLRQLDPAELSPGEFDHLVREAVEGTGARVVVLDSLNGYLNAMVEERAVLMQLHELLSYLRQAGILTLLTVAQHGLIGDRMQAPLDVSYLADSVVLLRYFEAAGQLRRAISVVKKRSGAHEPTIRELQLGPSIHVGEPLREFSGVLTAAPVYLGNTTELLQRNEDD